MTAHMSTIASKSTTRILPTTTTTTTHAQTTITHVLTTISKYTTRILPTVNTLGQTGEKSNVFCLLWLQILKYHKIAPLLAGSIIHPVVIHYIF
jgi:hypothetical protein